MSDPNALLLRYEKWHGSRVAGRWDKATKAFDHISLVLTNNSHQGFFMPTAEGELPSPKSLVLSKPIETLLARPDVVEAMQVLEKAAEQSAAQIAKAAEKGSAWADKKTGVTTDLSPTFVDAVARDLDRNARSFPKRVTAAAQNASLADALDEMKRIAADLKRRAYMSATVAIHNAYNQSLRDAWGDVVWNASLSKNRTCLVCAALHGELVSGTQEFDKNATWGTAKPPNVYISLLAPPRHPFCACFLSKDPGAVARAKMKIAAKQFVKHM